jgi:transcriptional regulator with XRE-family HTH domain
MLLEAIKKAAELEKKAGLKMSAVRNILTGKSNNPGIEVLSAIARLLGCSVDELTGETKSQSYISTIADLNKTKLTHTWNIELYQDCLNAIQHQIQIKNFKPTMEQILFFVKEAYIYYGKIFKDEMKEFQRILSQQTQYDPQQDQYFFYSIFYIRK